METTEIVLGSTPITELNPSGESLNGRTIEQYANSYPSLLFKVKRTQLEMLTDRGFEIPKEEQFILDKRTTVIDFITSYSNIARGVTVREALGKVYQYQGPVTARTPDDIYVVYPEKPEKNKKIGVDQILKILTMVSESSITHVIVISEQQLTNKAIKIIQDTPSIRFETFLYSQLAFNITKHVFVSKHELMTDTAVSALIKETGISLLQFPAASKEDPVIRYYGGKPGQVFKVTRTNVFYNTYVPITVSYLAVRDVPLVRKVVSKTTPATH